MIRMIYHMCRAEAWRQAVEAGAYRGSAQDLADGFIHFSTAAQVAESARRHRAGERDLVLIAVEDTALGSRLRWEPARNGDLFPHLYGALDPAEVACVRPLPLGADGAHVFPPLS